MVLNGESKKDLLIKSLSFSDYKRYYQDQLGEISSANSSGWVKALCPFHPDTTPSFHINFLKQGAYKCFSCNESGDIFTFHQKKNGGDFVQALDYLAAFIGLDFEVTAKNFNASSGKAGQGLSKKADYKKLGKPSKIYQYTDLNKNVLYEKCKYLNPKTFRIRRKSKKGKGQYVWSIKGIDEVLYNLPMVNEASTIYIVEGEKDADALIELNLAATTTCMGAGSWLESFTPYMQDKTVVILPDNDDPGREHAELVASQVKKVAKSIQIVELPGLPPKGDVSDWFEAGHGKEDLLKEIAKIQTYEDHIDVLNKKHAVIILGGKSRVLNVDPSKFFPGQSTISFSRINDFKIRYLNKKILNPDRVQNSKMPKTVTIADNWLQSPDRRECNEIIFQPGAPNKVKNSYNLWTGFNVKPNFGDWSFFRQHIRKIIANGNEQVYEWIITWMARICQDPGGKKPGTSIVLKGGQGAGKGCFVTIFGELFGQHFLQVLNQRQIVGRFNQQLQSIVLLFVDEGFWGGNKSSEGILKGLITEKYMTIEHKGENTFQVANHMNVIMASNKNWVVPSGMDERRFYTLDVSEEKKQNKKYFNRIYEQMEKQGGLEAMFHDLLKHDLTTANISSFPKNTATFTQVQLSMTPVQKFWFETLKEGKLFYGEESSADVGDWETEQQKISTELFYRFYIRFCDQTGQKYRESKSIFGRYIKQICEEIQRERTRTIMVNGRYDVVWHYIFPDLPRCQELFCEKINASVNWDSVLNEIYE